MLIARVFEIIQKVLPMECEFSLEAPPSQKFGDLACNAAMLLAKKLKKNPRELATEIAKKLSQNEFFEKVEVAGPGFLNIFLASRFFHGVFMEIEKAGGNFGRVDVGSGKKALLEFISANPTGPLTVANGRGGFGGDVLARILDRVGFEVSREYYVNDEGKQIGLLGRSIQFAAGKIQKEEDFYVGEYIEALAKKYPEKIQEDALATGRIFAEILLETEIKPAVARMGIKFNKWFSEASLRSSGEVEATLELLKSKDLTYKKDGALFLKTSEFGDDKDRVIIKSDGEVTYVLPDLAYHKDKFERGFTKLIDILGADHHGYVTRLKAGVKMLGFGNVEVVIAQLVKLFRGEEEVRMSKRAGNFELMDDLIDDVGVDVARWFFVMRDWNTHLSFDLDLAKKQSNDNPVFYVQYAYTRMASILKKAESINFQNGDLELLVDSSEFALIKKMAELPTLVSTIAENYAVHSLTIYACEFAGIFHKFYDRCRVVDPENSAITAARLRLIVTAKEVLRIVLVDLLGVEAPEKM